MGNSIVRIPFNEINLVPGNVLIEIDKKYKIEARSRDTGEVAKWDHLIRVSFLAIYFDISFVIRRNFRSALILTKASGAGYQGRNKS